ncbi:MAG: hypothetical protein Fur0018_13750 [Anaerolineales bacterium]
MRSVRSFWWFLVLLLTGCRLGTPLELVWQADLGGALRRPPLIAGDTLLAAPLDGALRAFDRRSGALRWQFSPAAGVWHESLAADEARAFIAGRDGVLYALSLSDGQVIWTLPLGADAPFSMLRFEDGLYLTTTTLDATLAQVKAGGAALWAVDAATGTVQWVFRSADYVFQSPFRVDNRIYVGGTYYNESPVDEGGWMHLYALNADDGSLVWRYDSTDGFLKAIYATETRLAYIAYTDFVVVLDTAYGQELWRRDTGNWVPSLTGSGDTVWFGSANTQVHAWDIRSGEVLWTHDLGNGSFNYTMHVPVPVGDRVYVLTQRGDIVSLRRGTGALRWRFATGREVQTGLAVSPDGWAYVGDQAGMLSAYRIRR